MATWVRLWAKTRRSSEVSEWLFLYERPSEDELRDYAQELARREFPSADGWDFGFDTETPPPAMLLEAIRAEVETTRNRASFLWIAIQSASPETKPMLREWYAEHSKKVGLLLPKAYPEAYS